MRHALVVPLLLLASLCAGLPARADQEPAATVAKAEIDRTVAVMRGRSQEVRQLLRDARRRQSGASIACLDEALSRSDVALRRARELGREALGAYERGDREVARAALAQVAEWHDAQRLAARDGRSCAPGRTSVVAPMGTTVVRVLVDPSIPPAAP